MKFYNKAFSLIELLVAITIGGLILAVVMASYVAMLQTSLRLDVARQLQKEANFAVIRMADRIRHYPVDASSVEKKLIIQDESEDVIFVFAPSQNDENGELTMDGQTLFSSNVAVNEVTFEYSFSEEDSSKLQPWVSIYLKISSEKYPDIGNWVKTTISSRIFE